MNLHMIIVAVVPVIFILALGFAAGKHHSFDNDQARGFSQLALHYALPASLFIGMAKFNRELLLQQGPAVIAMLVGYTVFYLVAYAVLRSLHIDKLRSVLLGYTVSSTAAPIYGLTVLIPVFGTQTGTGAVGLAALVTNLAQVSLVIYMLSSSSAKSDVSMLSVLGSSLKNPLIWCPVLGAILAILGWGLSSTVVSILNPLATAASGVAIFACGLALSSYPIHLTSRTVIIGSLVCIVVQPAMFLVVIKLLGMHGSMAQAIFVAAAMPTSTPSVLFAQQYRSGESETASIMLVTTVGMVVILPISIWISSVLA